MSGAREQLTVWETRRKTRRESQPLAGRCRVTALSKDSHGNAVLQVRNADFRVFCRVGAAWSPSARRARSLPTRTLRWTIPMPRTGAGTSCGPSRARGSPKGFTADVVLRELQVRRTGRGLLQRHQPSATARILLLPGGKSPRAPAAPGSPSALPAGTASPRPGPSARRCHGHTSTPPGAQSRPCGTGFGDEGRAGELSCGAGLHQTKRRVRPAVLPARLRGRIGMSESAACRKY